MARGKYKPRKQTAGCRKAPRRTRWSWEKPKKAKPFHWDCSKVDPLPRALYEAMKPHADISMFAAVIRYFAETEHRSSKREL